MWPDQWELTGIWRRQSRKRTVAGGHEIPVAVWSEGDPHYVLDVDPIGRQRTMEADTAAKNKSTPIRADEYVAFPPRRRQDGAYVADTDMIGRERSIETAGPKREYAPVRTDHNVSPTARGRNHADNVGHVPFDARHRAVETGITERQKGRRPARLANNLFHWQSAR